MKDLWDAQNLSIPQKVIYNGKIYNGKRFFRFVIVFKLQKIVILRTVHKNYLGNPKWLFYDFGQKSECDIITSDKNCYIHMLYHQQHPIFCVKLNFTFTQKT